MADPTRFLNLDEVLRIIADLKRRKRRSQSSHVNLVIFRLSCCCGLRRSEIAGLLLSDLVLGGARPCIIVRKDNTKGQNGKRRGRKVPLWWDAGTLDDLREWTLFRREQMRATDSDPFVCGVSKVNYGKPLTGNHLAFRWKTAIRCLGPERVRQLSIHCGRHSFCSLSKAAGHSSIEIRDAVGHVSEVTTNLYLHAVQSEHIPDVFAVRA
jgi:integrase